MEIFELIVIIVGVGVIFALPSLFKGTLDDLADGSNKVIGRTPKQTAQNVGVHIGTGVVGVFFFLVVVVVGGLILSAFLN